MQNPENLRVYVEARAMAVAVYKLTADFPTAEKFGLVAQLRRAAASVGSNIAEGCGRQGNRALVAFLHQALGSLNELEFQLGHAARAECCAPEQATRVLEHVLTTRRMLIRLIAVLRRRPDQPDH